MPGKSDQNPIRDFTTTIVPLMSPLQPLQSGADPTGYGKPYGHRGHGKTMKNWFKKCCQHDSDSHAHCVPDNVWSKGASGNLPSGNLPGGLQVLRLLDITDNNKLCLVKLHPDDDGVDSIRYAVLSYRIGGVDLPKYDRHDMHDNQVEGSIDLSDLPHVYRDAIWLTRRVGLNFLWIDSLCLMDSTKGGDVETRDKQHGMDNMDRIYGGAALTIVAADDHNAHGHLRAIDNHPVGRAPQPKETIYGQDWTVSKSLYDRLHNSPYVTRGWTYQELILSHRCLIFVNGLSYFRCRERLYAEDNFFFDQNDKAPSVAIMPAVYQTEFLPRHPKDPWECYSRHLQGYLIREISDTENNVNAFQGILNRINRSLNTHASITGLPEGMLDMALIWYHNPNFNWAMGMTPERLPRFPSWTWAAWKGPTWKGKPGKGPAWSGLVTIPWIPDGAEQDRIDWVQNHAGRIEYWYQGLDGSFRRAKTNGPHSAPPPFPAGVPPGLHCDFLVIKTHISQDFCLTDPQGGTRGSCELRTQQNVLLGIVYADDAMLQQGPKPAVLAKLCTAPNGDDSFDYSYPDGVEGNMPNPPISARDTSICWVLLLVWDTFSFERRGLGFIHTNKLGWINWSQERQYITLR